MQLNNFLCYVLYFKLLIQSKVVLNIGCCKWAFKSKLDVKIQFYGFINV